MSGRSFRLFALVGCLSLAAPIVGCAVGADLVNPAFLSSFGLDPETVAQPSGTIVVAFVNESQLAARFYAYSLPDASQLGDARNLVVDVEPSDVRFMVLDCPTGAFAPGIVVGGAVDSRAVISPPEGGTENTFELAWEGGALIGGVDFQCGDVIQVILSPELGSGFMVTVIPGR